MIKRNLFIFFLTLCACFGFSFIAINITHNYPFYAENDPTEIDITGNSHINTLSNAIQVALILDTSGSMNGLIEQAKSQLWNILNVLARTHKNDQETDLQIALYEYGNPYVATDEFQIHQLSGFTNDMDFISEKLFSLSTLVMTRIIIPFTSWEWEVGFLLTKQYIIHLDHYRIAFYTHISSSLIVLTVGAFLFSSFVLINFASLHRNLGKLYIGLILLLSAPSGLVMAFYDNGGILVTLSFLILTPLWWIFTVKGYLSIKNGNISAHKNWMVRSYALTLSAISLRFYQFLIGQFDLLNPEFQYLFVSWMSWLGNLIIAEFYIKFGKTVIRNLFDKTLHIQKAKSKMQVSE